MMAGSILKVLQNAIVCVVYLNLVLDYERNAASIVERNARVKQPFL